jgi:hypothetical protein
MATPPDETMIKPPFVDGLNGRSAACDKDVSPGQVSSPMKLAC